MSNKEKGVITVFSDLIVLLKDTEVGQNFVTNLFCKQMLSSLQSVWPEKSCQMSIKVAKNDFTRIWYILTPLQKLTKNVGDLGKLIVANGFKKLPKVQKIAQSGHTAQDPPPVVHSWVERERKVSLSLD